MAVILRAATRGSPLARWQTNHIARLLSDDAPVLSNDAPAAVTTRTTDSAPRQAVVIEPVVITTTGDHRTTTPIHQMGGKGVFVKEVQAAVLNGRADIAVHSAKDLPSETPPGLVLAAVPERGNPCDSLVGCRLKDLPTGAAIATGSVRRKAQLAWLRPDLDFFELRGNIDTRLRKAADYDAIIVAAAALERLEIMPEVLDVIDPHVLVPQVGQGAIAVECKADDHTVRELLRVIEHEPSRSAVDAERTFLMELGGGCDLPVGAHATPATPALEEQSGGNRVFGPHELFELTGLLASLDGRVVLKQTLQGSDPETLGRSVARNLIDRAKDSPMDNYRIAEAR